MSCMLVQPWSEGDPVGCGRCRVRGRVDWLLHKRWQGWYAHEWRSQEGHCVGSFTRRSDVRHGSQQWPVQPCVHEHYQVV